MLRKCCQRGTVSKSPGHGGVPESRATAVAHVPDQSYRMIVCTCMSSVSSGSRWTSQLGPSLTAQS